MSATRRLGPWVRSLSGTVGPKTGPPGTYYNSQLGAWIRKMGEAGIRMHTQEFASSGVILFPKLQSIRPASIDLGSVLGPAPIFAVGREGVGGEGEGEGEGDSKPHCLQVRTQALSCPCTLKGITDLSALARAACIQVKVRLVDAFSGGDEASFTLQDLVLGISDAGASLLYRGTEKKRRMMCVTILKCSWGWMCQGSR